MGRELFKQLAPVSTSGAWGIKSCFVREAWVNGLEPMPNMRLSPVIAWPANPKLSLCIQAAALPLVTITAWEALYDRVQLNSGDKVLIHAGAGGVGHVAIQLAKFRQAEVATTVSSQAKAEFVKSLGADLVLNYRNPDWQETLLTWTGGMGVDLAFDTVGGATFSETFALVRPYGQVVTLLEPAPETSWKLARRKNLTIAFTLMLTPELDDLKSAQVHQAQILQQAIDWVLSGQLKIAVGKTFPLGAAADAHQFLESGQGVGKIVLTI